ncbi:uncharacterized protein LOC127845395 isoform X2 [Dreissena polymorpha]|uniref:uncharacterized protein LOC127845395 isoform X2 n=1 Tax=Dreissena polymorpha TaxID=45954 RepID=UPI002264FC83|nr:uncharacterized protein LOC127845395 isoform X2 [Dreissena polymorpha]
MSRRKQSNPKPLKRSEDEEDEDGIVKEADQSEERTNMETDQSDSPIQSDQEDEPNTEELTINKRENDVKDGQLTQSEKSDKESEKIIKLEERVQKSGAVSPRRFEVMRRLNFPIDLLTLRQVEESEFLLTGIPWSVTTVTSVQKGSTIGPYLGETVALSSIKPGELVLQFQGQDGEFSFIKVTEETGAWLSLLRPAEAGSCHNTCVYFEGGKIWCEVEEDLDEGTELLASFTTSQGSPSASVEPERRDRVEAPVREARVVVPTGVKKPEAKSGISVTPQPALIYGCPFCYVRFSSRRTLDAHLTYYCSKKPAGFVSLSELQQRIQLQTQAVQLELQARVKVDDEDTDSPISKEQTTPRGIKRAADEMSPEPNENSSDAGSPRPKSPRKAVSHKCQFCSYSTDKPANLQLHLATHKTAITLKPTEVERLSVSPACNDEMFCKECKIQFSSMSTYQGHKEFYCRFRLGAGKESESELASPGSGSQAVNEMTLKVLKSNQLAVESQLSAKGQLHPTLLASSPHLLHSQALVSELTLKSQQNEITKTTVKAHKPVSATVTHSLLLSPKMSEDQPLDLSKWAKKDSDDEKRLVLRKSETSAKEISCKSEQLSPAAKKIKSEGKLPEIQTALPKTPLNIPTIHPSLFLNSQPIQYVNKKPIPPLQSVSRCVECNIVFYKHENYLIHKEHYCSGRHNGKESSSSDSENQDSDSPAKDAESLPKVDIQHKENGLKESKSNEKIKELKETVLETRKEVCYKYFCIPCKIKFSSAGTLNAHKEFYCPHGKENQTSLSDNETCKDDPAGGVNVLNYQCENCKTDFCSARLLKLHVCMGELSPSPLLRCPYCDYVTQTENRLSEHMKVHVPTKAFKCNLCGYRGNTARGMRMHGKVHMENGEEFTDDNMIEFEEPPLVPIQRNGLSDNKGPVDMETELIRMKNEPYKRRRSRKSFEKSENMVPFLNPTLQICAACGQTFTNMNDFAIHLRMHEIAMLEAMKNLKSLHCEHCNEYVAETLTSLLIHMQTKHPEQFPGTSKSEKDASSEDERSRSMSHATVSRSSSVESSQTAGHDDRQNCSFSSEKDMCHSVDTGRGESSYVEVKVEIDASDSEVEENNPRFDKVKVTKGSQDVNDLSVKSHHHSNASPSSHSSEEHRSKKRGSPEILQNEPLKSEVSRKTEGSLTNSKKLSVKTESELPQSLRLQTDFSRIAKETRPSSPRKDASKHEPKLSPKLLSPDPKTRYLMNIKQEQHSPVSTPVTPKKSTSPISPKTLITSSKVSLPLEQLSPKLQDISLLYNHPAIFSPYAFPLGFPLPMVPPVSLIASAPANGNPSERNGRKYCKHCDINFTYLSSFLTHKKYYCSARNGTEDTDNQTATA